MEKVFIIGVAGGSGSGKTTFSKKVINHADSEQVAILHMDSYYLPIQPKSNVTETGKANFDNPQAFDWDLLRYHIAELKDGKSIQTPTYDFAQSRRTSEANILGPAKVILFEGIFTLFDQDIREMLDIKCFLHVDSDIRFTRRLHRDVKERARSLESVISQYYETVRPMYEKYLAPQKQYADFVVGEETDVAAEILASRIQHFIKSPENFIFARSNTENSRPHPQF